MFVVRLKGNVAGLDQMRGNVGINMYKNIENIMAGLLGESFAIFITTRLSRT